MKIAITGASSGLGWQLALGLSRMGNELLLFGRDLSRLNQLKDLVEGKKALCTLCAADLLKQEGVDTTIRALEDFCPELLIQCAGVGLYGCFSDVESQASLDILRLNVLAVMETTHAWVNWMKQHPVKTVPQVVFIASAAAFLPMPGMASYAASKGCLLQFAEALRFEEEGKIHVLTVCPGPFETNFQKRAGLFPLESPSTDQAKKIAGKIIKNLHKTGVYVLFPWNFILPLRKILPKRFLMKAIEKKVLSMRRSG